MRRLLFIIALLISSITKAQSFEWWKELVRWDGVSHWSKYITYSPKYLGVNALPVPIIGNGSIDSINSIGATASFHFSKDDHSQNPVLYGNYCLVKERISIDVNWIPIEWFKMSHAIKEERKVFCDSYYDKKAKGDVLMNINIQLLNRWRKAVHLVFRTGFRYPASSGTSAARMTNTPGYYFDLSAGKIFANHPHWKWIAMAGFYVWQTNGGVHYDQDDAFLFGGGTEYNKKGMRLQLYIAGYLGYIDNGDKPLVFRLNAEKKLKKVSALLRFQQGLHDFCYSSFEAGGKFHIGE